MALKFGQQSAQASSNTKKFDKGSVIVQEGSRTAEMYVLLQGSATAYKNYGKFNQAEVSQLNINEPFGEMSLFLSQNHSTTLVATTEATVMVFDDRNFADSFASKPDVARAVLKYFCKKIDEANKILDKKSAPAAAVAAQPAPPPVTNSALFPEGHVNYPLTMSNNNESLVFKQNCKCPLCGITFENLYVLASRLRRESTDKDLRVHYADIEPMYYDIISCPNCLFSAPVDMFPKASEKSGETLHKLLNSLLSEVEIKTSTDRDSFTVFAGYYLALRCAPLCFNEPQMITAGLWQKLSRMYKDAGDENMYLMASQNAINDYEFIFQKLYISEKQSQQICYVLGDLYERFKNTDKALSFYYLAKGNVEGSPAIKIQCDKRIEELKEVKK